MQNSLFSKEEPTLIIKPDNKYQGKTFRNCILNGDSLGMLSKIPDSSIDCVITSPPYYGQRDYGIKGQIGCEQTPEEYIDDLCNIFDQCFRSLKDSGTFWLNLGDKYIDGELAGFPWLIAHELKKRGWMLRADIIWHKPNAMPSSVKNRPTTDHEYLFLFTKSKNYYYDADSIREPHVTFSENSKMRGGRNHFGKANGTPEKGKNGGNSNLHTGRWDQAFHPKGRSKRTVWSVPLSKLRDAHFAVFPEKLIEPCVLAGCPKGGIVLDPFFGSGTTGVVALQSNRDFLGIEINPEYCKIAKNRLKDHLLY